MSLDRRRTSVKRVFLSLLFSALVSAGLLFGLEMGLQQLGSHVRINREELYLFAGVSAFLLFVFTVHPANRPLRFLKNLGRLILLVLLAALVWGYAAVWTGQNAFLYPPVRANAKAEERLRARPNAEQMTIPGENGEQYNGWFIKNGTEKAGLILYFGGNGEESASRAESMAQLTGKEMLAGFHFMCLDYPGTGHSTGQRDEESIYRMARAAWDQAAAREDVNPEKIVLAGWSLGTGTAVRLTDEKHPAGLILFAPYYNGGELVRSNIGELLQTSIPIPLPIRNPYRSDHYARNIQTPVLVVAARDDRLVPYAQSQRLAGQFPAAQLVSLETGGHGAMWQDQAALTAVYQFLQGMQNR